MINGDLIYTTLDLYQQFVNEFKRESYFHKSILHLISNPKKIFMKLLLKRKAKMIKPRFKPVTICSGDNSFTMKP